MIRNSSVYIAVPPHVLVITTLFCYFIMRAAVRITGRKSEKNSCCTLTISYCGKEKNCCGKIDTGNTLREPFSGDPVIVVKKEVFPEIKCCTNESLQSGFRLIPFSSVGGDGLLPAFRAEKIIITEQKNNYRVSAYIAICENDKITGEIQALVPSALLY